jgi:hypothetical protein
MRRPNKSLPLTRGPKTMTSNTAPFVPVSPGTRRRADGAEIRKMRATDIRDLFRGRFSITRPWWIAFTPDGTPMRGAGYGWAVVGGATIKKALRSVVEHERVRECKGCGGDPGSMIEQDEVE